MQRTVLFCAALAFGIVTSPLVAQQTTPDQPSAPTATEQQTAPEPPPFPPMPKARPTHRHVELGESRASRSHHRAARAHHERTRAHRKAVAKPSRKMVRKCHAMSYRQIMRSDTCRALMKQELGASERHAKRHRHEASRRHRHHHHRTR
jgi:hypothetical protein